MTSDRRLDGRYNEEPLPPNGIAINSVLFRIFPFTPFDSIIHEDISDQNNFCFSKFTFLFTY